MSTFGKLAALLVVVAVSFVGFRTFSASAADDSGCCCGDACVCEDCTCTCDESCEGCDDCGCGCDCCTGS
ncbi:MAG: hypothetical protein MI725_09415 [Pirellulales bacterium]|nr:hypothetical protein [Pirellulales bacterium]